MLECLSTCIVLYSVWFRLVMCICECMCEMQGKRNVAVHSHLVQWQEKCFVCLWTCVCMLLLVVVFCSFSFTLFLEYIGSGKNVKCSVQSFPLVLYSEIWWDSDANLRATSDEWYRQVLKHMEGEEAQTTQRAHNWTDALWAKMAFASVHKRRYHTKPFSILEMRAWDQMTNYSKHKV